MTNQKRRLNMNYKTVKQTVQMVAIALCMLTGVQALALTLQQLQARDREVSAFAKSALLSGAATATINKKEYTLDSAIVELQKILAEANAAKAKKSTALQPANVQRVLDEYLR